MAAAQIHQRNDGGHTSSQRSQPGCHAGAQQDAVCAVEIIERSGHQQAVCAELLVLELKTVPSLVVIEQLSRLTRNRLDASTEPTSDCEIGVTVIDQGM